MREDPLKPKGYNTSKIWAQQRYSEDLILPNTAGTGKGPQGKFKSNSLSGHERNRLFLHTGKNYEDLTLISGADFLADGRGFAWTDFDQDGFLDMIVTSLDVPRVRILRNRCHDLGAKNEVLTIRLSGAMREAAPNTKQSNRDGIGALLLISYPSGKKLALQKQCGEGFSVQNSSVLRAPANANDFPTRIEVRWPSGKTSHLEPQPTQLTYSLAEP